MFYQPKADKKGAVTAAALLVMSVIVAAVAPLVSGASGAINIAAICLLAAALFVTTRYAISEYAYQITQDSLVITRRIGTKTSTQAALSLKTGEGIVKKPRSKEEKRLFKERFGKTDSRLNYCRNIFAKQYVYITEFNGKRYEILLEVDDEFAAALEDAVKTARMGGDE